MLLSKPSAIHPGIQVKELLVFNHCISVLCNPTASPALFLFNPHLSLSKIIRYTVTIRIYRTSLCLLQILHPKYWQEDIDFLIVDCGESYLYEVNSINNK